jgi:hypothetical protein
LPYKLLSRGPERISLALIPYFIAIAPHTPWVRDDSGIFYGAEWKLLIASVASIVIGRGIEASKVFLRKPKARRKLEFEYTQERGIGKH